MEENDPSDCIFKNIGNCDIYISLIKNVLFLGH